MDWVAVKGAIVDAVQAATGIDDVIWQHQSQGWREGVHVDLVLRSIVGIGEDEYRQEFDEDDNHPIFTACGYRRATLSVRIESDSQIEDEDSPGYYAGLLRTRLRRPAVKSLLLAEDIAIARILATNEADFEFQSRWVSLAQTDIILVLAENDSDDTASEDWIEFVRVQSDKLKDPSGSDSPHQLDLFIPEEPPP